MNAIWRDGTGRSEVLDGQTAGLIGRSDDLARLAIALRDDRPVIVSGEAGIGKTTLVRAAAATIGRDVHEGGGFATLAWMPYLALRRATGRAFEGEPSGVASIVEREVGPDLLFIDDLQWTDRDTRAVLRLLLGRIGLVLAIRDADPHAASAIAEVGATDIERRTVTIGALDRPSAVELAARLRPDLSATAITRLVDQAGGNPLVIEELARHGQASPSLKHAVTIGVAALKPADRRALGLLAVADRPLPLRAIGPAGQRLVAAGFLRQTDAGLEVRHALVAEAVASAIDADTRRALHRRLALLTEDPAERARHLSAGGRRAAAARVAQTALAEISDPRTRAALLVTASECVDGEGGESLRLAAAHQFQVIGDDGRVVQLLTRPISGSDEARALRIAMLADALIRTGRPDEAVLELRGAAELRPDPQSPAAIELELSRATALVNIEGRLDDAIEGVASVAARMGQGIAPPRLGALLARLRLIAGYPGQVEALEKVWADSRTAGDVATAAGAAASLVLGQLIERGSAAAGTFAVEASDYLRSRGWLERATAVQVEGAQIAVFAGNLRRSVLEADELLEQPLVTLERHRLLCIRALALVWLGRFDDGARTLSIAEETATADYEGLGEVLHAKAELSFWSGRPGPARELAEAALQLPTVSHGNFAQPALTRAWAELDLERPPSPLPPLPTMRVLEGAGLEYDGLARLARGDAAGAVDAFDGAAAAWNGYHAPRELICQWAAGESARRLGAAAPAAERLEIVLARATEFGFEPLGSRIRRSLRLLGRRSEGSPRRGGTDGGLLTPREREVVLLVGRGMTNTEIARRLGLGRPSVARMLSNAMLKLEASTRAQAVALAVEI